MPQTSAKARPRFRLEDPPLAKKSKGANLPEARAAKSRVEKERKAQNLPVRNYKYRELVEAYAANGDKPRVSQGRAQTGSKQDAFQLRKPLFVTEPSVGVRIINLIKEGAPSRTACQIVGVRHSTFLHWLELGKEEVNIDYAQFYDKVVKAEGQAELNDIKKFEGAAKGEWRAWAWKLERRYESWGKVSKAEVTVKGGLQISHKHKLAKGVVDDPTSRELARKLIDGNDYGYSDISREVSNATEVDTEVVD